MTSTMNPPQIKVKDTYDFIFSAQGRETQYFLYYYLQSNAELRRKRQLGLRINYENLDKTPDSDLSEDEVRDKVLAKRTFSIEIIAQTMMTLEDLAAFCLAFEKPLEELPLNVVGYNNSDINRFYQKDFNSDYFSDLLLLSDPLDITGDKELIEKIDVIQNQNIEAFDFHFKKFVKYRRLFERLYSKNKHGNPLFLNFSSVEQVKLDGIDKEDLDVVIYYDSDRGSQDLRVEGIILGRNTIDKSMGIMRHASDILVTLIHRRLDYLKYDENYPPLFVFGENPLEKEMWGDYMKKIKGLLPVPTETSINLDVAEVDVREQSDWLHSSDWESKWFKEKEWEFEEGSKVKKNF